MSSETSTDTQGLQPWQFFGILTMLAATAAVVMVRDTTLPNLLFISVTVMAVGLVAAAVHRTLAPLARGDERDRRALAGGRTRLALDREKTLVLRSIKELEFDRAMGKIAEADYHEMVPRLRARAMGLLKQIEQEQPDWHAEIERELERRLAATVTTVTPGHAAAPQATTATAPQATAPAAVFCTSCGTRNDGDARFCKACGGRLEQPA